MKKPRYLSLALFIMLSIVITNSYGQSSNEISERSSVMDRIYTGGGLGMSFSSDFSYVQASPLIGYRVTNELSAGIAFSYRYSKYKIFNVSTSNYGINPFVRYNIIEPFFLQAEYEYLSYEYPYAYNAYNEVVTRREGFSSVLVGGGISQPIGSRAFFNLLVLYNLSYVPSDLNSPYSSPLVIRGGISLGF